jgi:DNA adenine methylase
MSKPFLRWLGNKSSIMHNIKSILPGSGNTLIEPFVGSGSVFLNTDYDHYILADYNEDLINVYLHLKNTPSSFIRECEKLFRVEYNTKDRYLKLREIFNDRSHACAFCRAIIFVYLNRHGYGGLCRYNKKGGFNVAFNNLNNQYFPKDEMQFFAQKLQKSTVMHAKYQQTLAIASEHDCVIYCDPPYLAADNQSIFTKYTSSGFSINDHITLAATLDDLALDHGITSVISNADTEYARSLYSNAQIKEINVRRNINAKASTSRVAKEILAKFQY